MSSRPELPQALDECLAAAGSGGADGAQVAARYPGLAGELEPLLAVAAKLQAQPPLPMPSPEFRARLAAALAHAPPPRALRADRPAIVRLRGLGLRRSLVYGTAVLAACAAFLVVGAVQASASATPGQPTYWLKRRLESARLLLAGDRAIALHLALADRRLSEAVASPAYGGLLLADFSREVTASLVEADEALQAGAERGTVVDPLLVWLHGCRERLYAARPGLPPTAWRAALALVEEAIAALTTDESWSGVVPRLADARQLLQAQWLSGGAWPDVAVAERKPIESGSVSALGYAEWAPPVQEGTERGHSHRDPAGQVAVGMPTTTASPAPPATREAPPARGVASATATRVDPPTEPPPVPIEPPATVTMAPTDPPPALPTLVATATPSVAPTASPTEPTVPEPSATPDLPEIAYLACAPQTIEVYGQSRCEVRVAHAEGLQLSYSWTTDWGVMYNADQPVAMFHAVLSMGGISKFDAPVRVSVRTASGLELSGETVVFVVPRLNAVQGPAAGKARPVAAAGTQRRPEREASRGR